MASTITQYRVFLASPGGLDEERRAFCDVLRDFSDTHALRRSVLFTPVGWEETLPGMGRAQSRINDDVEVCDWFVLVLWNRWGSPPAVDGPYSSGCEEEFDLALECVRDPERPMRDVVVFFKAVDDNQMADQGPQLKKVLKFRRRLEKTKEHFFKHFDDLELFRSTLRRLLDRWLDAHERGVIEEHDTPETWSLDPEHSEGEGDFEPPADDTQNDPSRLETAEHLANEGRLTEAEVLLANSIARGSDPDAFNRYGHFLRRLGQLARAKEMYERVLDLAEATGEARGEGWKATAYNNLGLIYRTRGDLERAEEMYQRALEINEQLGRRESMAGQYSNLAFIYKTQGELERAEKVVHKALEIFEQLGHRGNVARCYGNLGLIYQTRDELERAEKMHQKALEINEQLGSRMGMATNYGNLGVVYQMQGDLERAEKVHRKALEIDEQLRHREGMANAYGNLGVIYRMQDDLERAEKMYRKALEIDELLGRREGMAISYGNLGVVYRMQGDLERAEKMHRKALDHGSA